MITVYPAAEELSLPARNSFVASQTLDTAVLPRHLWGHYDQPDPVVVFRPGSRGFEVNAQDEARVVDDSGKSVNRIPKPTGDTFYRLRLDAAGRPSRFLAVRSVQPA